MIVKKVGATAVVKSLDPEMLKRKLTLESTGDRKVVLKLYSETEDGLLIIPRGLVLDRVDYPSRRRFKSMNCKKTGYKLYPKQESLVEMWKSVKGNGIIKAPTGSGKTIMGITAAVDMGLKTLVVVPTAMIFNQWIQRIKEVTNARDIGVIRQDVCRVGPSFTVGMIHTLAKNDSRFPKGLFSEFGTVIFDECHRLSAPTFSVVAGLFDSRYRLGLSATPRRKDGLEAVFKYHIGPVLQTSSKMPVKPRVGVVMIESGENLHKGCIWGGKLILGRYLNRLVKSDFRNRLIVKCIWEAYRKGHRILVLTDRLAHITYLKCLLDNYKISPEEVGEITSTSKDTKQRILLATYGSAGMGLDIPELTCVMFTTPRVDIEQAVGRVTRKCEGKMQPLVLDFVDVGSNIIYNWYKARLRFYMTITDDIKVRRVR